MEKIVRQSLLYDFYGELLTQHQKSVYEDVINNDLSYSEIARMNNISRQGVYDMIKRCDRILEEYEDKLQLVHKFISAKQEVDKIRQAVSDLKEHNTDDRLREYIDKIDEISGAILDEF